MTSSKTLLSGVAFAALATVAVGAAAQPVKPTPIAVEKGSVLKAFPVQPPPAGVYTFTLNNFRITDTRSLHNDTDYVTISVAVNGQKPITLPAKSMGDVNNGTHQVNLTIPNVTVGQNNTVAFVYTIVNSGFNSNSVEQALQKIVNAGAEKGAGAGSTALCGLVTANPAVASTCGTVGTSAATWIMGKLDSILFANCDGTVAAATHGFTGSALAQGTANGAVISGTDDNKGTDSPTGCGANSRYFVSWTITGKQLPQQPPPVSGGGGTPKCQANGEGCLKQK
jgi:hypothetical protein